jgi:hypothetical protein
MKWFGTNHKLIDAIQLRKVYTILGFEKIYDFYHLIDSLENFKISEMSIDERVRDIQI